MNPDKVILVRHGETDWNKEGRFLGQSNPPLNKQGILQAEAAAARWANEKIDRIFSSDLLRTIETSQIIANLHNRRIITVPYLREIDFGAWEGLKYEEIQKHYPELLKNWVTDAFHTSVPEGETPLEVIERVQNAWNYINITANDGDTIMVVTHGGPLSFLICRLSGLNPERHKEFLLSPGESIELRRKGNLYSVL